MVRECSKKDAGLLHGYSINSRLKSPLEVATLIFASHLKFAKGSHTLSHVTVTRNLGD